MWSGGRKLLFAVNTAVAVWPRDVVKAAKESTAPTTTTTHKKKNHRSSAPTSPVPFPTPVPAPAPGGEPSTSSQDDPSSAPTPPPPHHLPAPPQADTSQRQPSPPAAPSTGAANAEVAPVAPPNITVVNTVEELEAAALGGAQDIEIRSHLNLRHMRQIATGALGEGEGPTNSSSPTALIYASAGGGLRSIRGNCSSAGAAAVLHAALSDKVTILPLKPHQCMLVVATSWLVVGEGAVWVDNVYLHLSRDQVQPDMAFISAGTPGAAIAAPQGAVAKTSSKGVSVFMTNTTLQGEGRGAAQGLASAGSAVKLLVNECIFSDWTGYASPLTVTYSSTATVHNSVFRNHRLGAEIVDVSFNGMVHLENVRVANATVKNGAFVSTTLNDYHEAPEGDFWYDADDDAVYDVPLTAVPIEQRSLFREQFLVTDAFMSDCRNMQAANPGALPGCANASRRNLGTARPGGTGGDSLYGPEAPGNNSSGLVPGQEDAAEQEYEYTNDNDAQGEDVLARFLHPHDPWLAAMRGALPGVATDPDWPPFEINFPPKRGGPKKPRTSLKPRGSDRLTPDDPAYLGPLGVDQPAAAPAPAAGAGSSRTLQIYLPWLFAAVVVVAAVVAVVCVAFRRRLCRMFVSVRAPDPHSPRTLRGGAKRKQPRMRPMGGMCWGQSLHSKSTKSVDVPLVRGGGFDSMNLHARNTVESSTRDSSSAASSVTWRPLLPAASVARSGSDPAQVNPVYEYSLPAHLALVSPEGSGATTTLHCSTADAPLNKRGHNPAQLGTTRGPQHAPAGTVHEAACCAQVGEQAPRDSPPQSCAGAGSSGRHDGVDRGTAECMRRREEGESFVTAVSHCPDQELGAMVADQAPGANLAAAQLLQQLDSFGKGDLLLGRFEMLGRQHRRVGGQGVVQFVQDSRDRCDYAVKFFLHRDAFLNEAALYTSCFACVRSAASPDVRARADASSCAGDPSNSGGTMSTAVARFLPQVEAVCDSATAGSCVRDAKGWPLPPCVVMEKGESLHDLCDRAEPELFTALAILSSISKRMADMHEVGYVHRDLKPSNIIWLPRQNRWTVIDFGCIARVGEAAPMCFTLTYAAPEVVRAYIDGKRRHSATAAVDAWSLGVMAFELLTGTPAFDLVSSGRQKVMDMLSGNLPLPWEGELRPRVAHSLGPFREAVLQLLQRDPDVRSTMQSFHSTCSNLFHCSSSASGAM